MEIIDASDAGEKRYRNDFEGVNEDMETESETPTLRTNSSAAYNRENKVPIEQSAAAPRKKKRATPPRKGMLCRDIQDHFPDIDVGNSDNDSDDEFDEVSSMM